MGVPDLVQGGTHFGLKGQVSTTQGFLGSSMELIQGAIG